MIEKKSSKGSLEKRRTTFLIIGFVIIFGLVYMGFEFFATAKKTIDLGMLDDIEIVVNEADAPITDQTPPPQPPTQQQKDYILEIVKNEIEVNLEGISFNVEVHEGDEIPPYEPVTIISEKTDDAPPVYFPEEMPEPIGGYEAMYAFLHSNLKYPEKALIHRISGQVHIEFVVEKDGSISNVNVKFGVFPDLDQEAVRVVKMMPKWKPGKQMGKTVRCYFQIPIRFTIN